MATWPWELPCTASGAGFFATAAAYDTDTATVERPKFSQQWLWFRMTLTSSQCELRSAVFSPPDGIQHGVERRQTTSRHQSIILLHRRRHRCQSHPLQPLQWCLSRQPTMPSATTPSWPTPTLVAIVATRPPPLPPSSRLSPRRFGREIG